MSFDDELLKARRNLLIASLVLIFFDFTKSKIIKLGFSGLEIDIGNPYRLRLFVFFTIVYLIIRYTQFILNQKNLRIVDTIKDRFSSYMFSIYFKSAVKKGQTIKRGGTHYDDFRIEGLTLTFLFRDFSVNGAMVNQHEAKMRIRNSIIPAFRAFMYFVFHSEKFTEYILPYILAFWALCICIKLL